MANQTIELLEKRRLIDTAHLISFVRYCLIIPLVAIGIPFAVFTGAVREMLAGLAIALVVLLYNIFGQLYLKNKREALSIGRIRVVAFSQLLADVLVFTYLIHLTGGIASPYLLFYFLPIAASGFLFPEIPWMIPILSSVITVSYIGVLLLEYYGIMPLPGNLPWMQLIYSEPVRVITSGLLVPLSIWFMTLFTAQATALVRTSREAVKQDIESEIGDIKAQLDLRLDNTMTELNVKNHELEAALTERRRTEQTMDKFTMIREMDIIELKKEINQLLISAGRVKKYDI